MKCWNASKSFEWCPVGILCEAFCQGHGDYDPSDVLRAENRFDTKSTTIKTKTKSKTVTKSKTKSKSTKTVRVRLGQYVTLRLSSKYYMSL